MRRPTLQLQSLQVSNFRCFERVELALDDQVTLLVGVNGAGKTALLDAAAIALGAWLGGTRQASAEDQTFQARDARLIRQDTPGLPTANPSYPIRIEATGLVQGPPKVGLFEPPGPICWSRELRKADGRTTHGEATNVREAARWSETEAAKGPSPLPVLAYYGTGRLWVQKRDKLAPRRRQAPSRMTGYSACLAFESNHKLFEKWMGEREAARVQEVANATERGDSPATVRSPPLDAVEGAALACLPGAKRFYYSLSHHELRVELEDGQVLPFSSLSDGQRGLILLAADIAWRSVQLNPHLGRSAPEEADGVILIDEIELHLHPQWQREVITRLTRAFPRMQFVITTHSPQVVAGARPEWLRVISASGAVTGVDYTFGRDSNALLRDIFGVSDRPDEVRLRLTEADAMLARGDLDGARALLHDLEADLGPHDDLVAGLRWELHDRALANTGRTGDDG